MPFVLSTSDAASRSASTEEEYRLSESADATMAQNYGDENAFSTAAYDMVTKISQNVVNARTIDGIPDGELKDRQVSTALNKMRRDVISLDALASSRSQLTLPRRVDVVALPVPATANPNPQPVSDPGPKLLQVTAHER